MLIQRGEELAHRAREVAVDLGRAVDLLVVLALGARKLREALLAHGDVRLADAVLDHVRHERGERPGVVGATEPVLEVLLAHEARADGVLAVLPHVGDDVRNPHDAALERHGAQVGDGLVSGLPAALNHAVERVEVVQAARLEALALELAVVADDAVERLERHVAALQHVEHAHALHVVAEPPAGALVVDVVQEALARMSERRVAEVVPERDGLYEVEVEPEGAADVARDAADELLVEAAAGEVVVLAEREHLRLAVEAVVRGGVHDLLRVAHEGGTNAGVKVALGDVAPDDGGVLAGERAEPACGRKRADLLCHLGRDLHGHAERHAVDPCVWRFLCWHGVPLLFFGSGYPTPNGGHNPRRAPYVALPCILGRAAA